MYVYTHVEEKLLYRGERTKFIHTRVRMYIQDSAVRVSAYKGEGTTFTYRRACVCVCVFVCL